MIGIYKITSPTKRVYIGQSKNIKKRFTTYKRYGCITQPKLQRSFSKYGALNHNFEIILECEILELNEKERYYQDLYSVLKTGLNCILTQTNDKPREISKETRIKLGIKHIGNTYSLGRRLSEEDKIKLRGWKHTLESKQKISKAGLGRVFSEESRKKISENNRNRIISDETRKKMSDAQAKTETKEKFRKSRCIPVLDLNTGVYYDSIQDLADLLGLKYATLKARLRGKNKTSYILT